MTIGKEKNKFTPTDLGCKTTEFLNTYFPKIMDYEFTKKMEKDLDKIAKGKIKRNDIVTPFSVYLYEQIIKIIKVNNTIYTVDVKNINNLKSMYDYFQNYKNNSEGKNKSNNLYGEINGNSVYLINGSKGSFIACGNSTLTITDKDDKDKMLLQLKNKISDSKEWIINKKTYVLRKGDYGHFISEVVEKGKKGKNYSIKFLLNKISSDNKLDIDEDIDKIIKKITIKMLSEQISYYKNKK